MIENCLGPVLGVPLNIMCSIMWARPPLPKGSFRAPALYQIWTVTTGALGSSTRSTLRPLGKIVSVTRSQMVPAAAGAANPTQSTSTPIHTGNRHDRTRPRVSPSARILHHTILLPLHPASVFPVLNSLPAACCRLPAVLTPCPLPLVLPSRLVDESTSPPCRFSPLSARCQMFFILSLSSYGFTLCQLRIRTMARRTSISPGTSLSASSACATASA